MFYLSKESAIFQGLKQPNKIIARMLMNTVGLKQIQLLKYDELLVFDFFVLSKIFW